MEVLFFEIEEIVEHPLTACNLDCLAAQLVDRYGGAEQAIAALRSGKMKFEEVSSRSGSDAERQVTLLDPDENVLLVFFVDPEDYDSLVEFLYSLTEVYGPDHAGDIMAKILGTAALTRAICEAAVMEGLWVRVDDEHYRLADWRIRPTDRSGDN
jgi:hypothetical protein